MSSRALRRLQEDATLIKLSGDKGLSSEDEDDQPGFARSKPKSKNKKDALNPFAVLFGDADDEGENESDRDSEKNPREEEEWLSHKTTKHAHLSKRKKKKKKSKQQQQLQKEDVPEQGGGMEEVDAAIKEVNELLGEADTSEGAVPSGAMTTLHRSLLCVERRFLNAENEMRRIFGSRVVRAEAGRHRAHRRVHHRPTHFTTPKDTWPKMDKPGLSMELGESKNGCQYFTFKHSPEYQKVQFQFLQAVETFDPNTIAAILHAHPYHIDSLLQLSEVCKMSEDMQMATELLERALYCFECNFHTLFNIAYGNCRFNYSITENRPFFIALFRHLYYIGRKGCHRTALEFCKLLLSLDPEGDPLCLLLMIDYYALMADEYDYLLTLFQEWDTKRNLSQLPNFAFSVPLALFHSNKHADSSEVDVGSSSVTSSELTESSAKLQDALLMFPNVLIPLMDKCGVVLDPVVMTHPYFTAWNLNRDPKALQLLQKLFIERNHSLWKVPEVLTWLEVNCREVVARVNSKDPLIADYSAKRERRYIGTPRNIYRHVIMSDFDQVTATLPRDLSESGIMMYDPLPPLDSTTSYPQPPATSTSNQNENPLLLFLRSMLPTFENFADEPVGAGGMPIPPQQRLRAQFAARQRQLRPVDQHAQGEDGGGVEGNPGRPIDLQASLNDLVGMLQRVLDLVPTGRDSDGYDSSSTSDDNA